MQRRQNCEEGLKRNKGENCAFKSACEVINRPLFEKRKKPSPVGCAIQLCAPLTDWNIPHRGLASLLLDSCLYARRKTIFDNYCSLFINWWKGAVHVWIFCTPTGQFNILHRLRYSYVRLPLSPCKSNKHSFFYYYYTGIFHRSCYTILYCRRKWGIWTVCGFFCGFRETRQPGKQLNVLSVFVCSAFYSDGLFTELLWIKSGILDALCFFFLFFFLPVFLIVGSLLGFSMQSGGTVLI